MIITPLLSLWGPAIFVIYVIYKISQNNKDDKEHKEKDSYLISNLIFSSIENYWDFLKKYEKYFIEEAPIYKSSEEEGFYNPEIYVKKEGLDKIVDDNNIKSLKTKDKNYCEYTAYETIVSS